MGADSSSSPVLCPQNGNDFSTPERSLVRSKSDKFVRSSGIVSHLFRVASSKKFSDEDRKISDDIEIGNDKDMCMACTGLRSASSEDSLIKFSDEHSKNQIPAWEKTYRWLGKVINPRTSRMLMWTRFFLATAILSLTIDPCFLYVFTVDSGAGCLRRNTSFLVIITFIRSMTDAVGWVQIFMNLKTAYVPESSMATGRGDLETNPRLIVWNYVKPKGKFWLDLLAAFPLTQILVWWALPTAPNGNAPLAMISVLPQMLPKVWKIISVFLESQKINGIIFEASWGGFVLNLGGYVISGFFFGSLWYLLAIVRVTQCLRETCSLSGLSACNPSWLDCSVARALPPQPTWPSNNSMACFAVGAGSSPYPFGLYGPAVQSVVQPGIPQKMMLSLFFGIMTLSSFGNALTPTYDFAETTFACVFITSGLVLFVLLIGNVQHYLRSLWAHSADYETRQQSLEWWMRRRQLPVSLRRRVRRQAREVFVADRGVSEADVLGEMPVSLRRDVKRALCLESVKRVPLLAELDSVVLDNICDKLKPVLFIENMVILREGEPVNQMLFIIRGKLQSKHVISKTKTSTCVLGESNFCGEELLSLCIGNDRNKSKLPICAATVTTVTVVEAFALTAEDLRYVVHHFGKNFGNKRMKDLLRYYSASWRTWAAVNIQLAWRRYKAMKAIAVPKTVTHESRLSKDEDMIRVVAAILTAPKPHE